MKGRLSARALALAPLGSFPSLAPLVSLVVLTAACGGGQKPPPVSAPVAAAPPPAPPPDLSAVPEPRNLAIFARLAKPSQALQVVGGWTRLPMPGGDAVTELVTGESLGDLVDLNQPIDFALDATPRGMSVKANAVISAAVKSLDQAKGALAKYKLVPAANGALRIEGLGRPATEDEPGGDARVCELAPSFGAAPTRIVCGDTQAALDALAPYLTRSAPRATFPADLHIEARTEPIRPVVEQSRRALPLVFGAILGVQRGTGAVNDAFNAAIGDLADLAMDMDKLTIDVMLADPQATVNVTANFRSTTSLLARLAVGHPERASTPPETFWRLPGDADSALFHRGIDPADFTRPRDRVVAMLGAALEKEGLGEADRKAIDDAASHTLDLFARPSVYAKGVDLPDAERALAALKQATEAARPEAERAALEKAGGWSVMELDEAPAKVVAVAKEWPAAFARAGVAKWLKTQAPGGPTPSVRTAPMPKGLTAPKDAVHLAVTMPRPAEEEPAKADTGKKGEPAKKAKAGPAPKPIVMHVLVLPDGDRTWLVLSADEALAAAKGKAVLTPGDASTLAKRGGLDAMHDARINAGGFLSPRGLVAPSSVEWVVDPHAAKLAHDPFAAFANSPQQGTTPIPFTMTSQPGGGAAPAGIFLGTATVPKGAIEDVVRIAMRAMRRF